MIRCSTVSFYYDSSVSPVLTNISLEIKPGETIALIGANGSGKSTLMKLLCGIVQPITGDVIVDNKDTTNQRERWEIRKKVGMVFQHPDDQIISDTVLDEIAFGPENLGLPRHEIEQRIEEVTKLLELQDIQHVAVHELSFGEKQRIAIAGILAMHPTYLLLDEPTTFLPPEVTKKLIANLQQLAKEKNLAVVMSTHSMEDVLPFDRCIVMHQGKIAFDGTPKELFADVKKIQTLGLMLPEKRITPYDSGLSRIKTLDSGCGLSALPETDTPSKPLFEVKHLSHTYLEQTPFARIALQNLTATIAPHSFTAFVGTTQSGKSTLVDCLSGVITTKPNTVHFEGRDISEDKTKLRQTVGVVYQDAQSQIIADIVGKDITLGIKQKVTLQQSREIVKESLEAVGLDYEEFRNRYTYTLSGGEYQRVAIAGVLAQNPQILILDEPIAGLDPQAKAGFLSLIHRLHKEKQLTIIYMTMHLQDIVDLADTMYEIKDGRIL